MTTRPVLNGWQAILAAANPESTRGPRITQALLEELEELKRLDERRRQLREDLLSLWAEGAEVEPGPLRVEVREQESRIISFAKLCAIGGVQWAKDVRSHIEPTVSYRLIISDDEQTAYGSRQRSASLQGPIPRGWDDDGIRDVLCADDL